MAGPADAGRTGAGKRRLRLSLGARIFLATALIVSAAVTAAVALTYVLGNHIADRAARDTLERSSWVQSTFKDTEIETLRLTSRLVAGDPAFSAYVADALDLGDAASLRDQLEARRRDLDAAFAIVLDADGFVVAQAGDVLAIDEDFSGEALYTQALDDYDAAGLWARGERLFYVAAVPITAGGLLQGFLIAAEAVDDGRANDLKRTNGAEVTFVLTPEGAAPAWVATTLDTDMADGLLAAVAARPGLLGPAAAAGAGDPDQGHLEVELRRERWLALVRPLEDVAGRTLGAAINLVSVEKLLEPYRRIGSIFVAVGLGAVLTSLLISFLLPRRVLQPISKLAAAAQAAAEGDYDQEIEAESSDEVGQLATAFSALLSELREKRDMEVYVSELARNLPDDAGGAAAVPAAVKEAALLGVELRDYASEARPPAGGPADPERALEILTRDLKRLSRAVRAHDGEVEAVLGHRLVASFAGAQRSPRALAAAADVLAGSAAPEASYSLAVAVVTGQALTGTVTWDHRPAHAVAGRPVERLEALLRVARSGTVLLSKSTHDELAAALTAAGVQAQEHRSTVSPVPLYSLGAGAVAAFRGPGTSATLEMTASGSAAAATLSSFGPGSVLAQRFEILSELGAGGMGVVYKARDRTLDELVALKMLKQEVVGGEHLARLKDELRLARKISHPNVLSTFDFGEAEGFPFISMEYVRGITLKQLLTASGALPLSAGLRLARQLCRGLQAAHSKSVLHRDIKPENMIIEPNGNAKLMDFGIARPIQRSGPAQTQPGTLIGTPFYLAPEQLEGEEPDERADIYACGVVFYEIFTGELPYPAAGNLMEVIHRKMSQEPTPPSAHWPAIPHTLEAIILRCLERDRERRFRDAGTLLEELEILRA